MDLSANIISYTQQHVCDILNSDEELSSVCTFIPENIKEIDFQIKKALQTQGLATVVMTPNLSYRGRDDKYEYFDLFDAELDITENVTVNRSSNRKTPYASAQDVAIRALQLLTGPTTDNKANIQPKSIETGDYNGLLLSKVTFDMLVAVSLEK